MLPLEERLLEDALLSAIRAGRTALQTSDWLAWRQQQVPPPPPKNSTGGEEDEDDEEASRGREFEDSLAIFHLGAEHVSLPPPPPKRGKY